MIFGIPKLLSSIDKNTALNHQSLGALTKDFDEHKKSEYNRRIKQEEWEQMILTKVKTCPETEHIKIQNGKLDKLTTEVAVTRGTVKFWCYIFAALIVALTIGTVLAGTLK